MDRSMSVEEVWGAIAERDKLYNAVRCVNPSADPHLKPILIKDNIDTADLPTTAGAVALEHRMAPCDARVVTLLKRAGYAVAAKTNLTEFANYVTPGLPNGFSGLGGQVVSTFGRHVNPSGSSTGSAVAVAAGYAPVALGTETSGSVISPASAAWIVGIKPTVGLVSREGVIPLSPSMDTVGVMGVTVAGCAKILDIIAEDGPSDGYALAGFRRGAYEKAAMPGKGLKGMKLGLDARYRSGERVSAAPFFAALETLRGLGVAIEPVELPPYPLDAMYAIFRNEFRESLDAALAGSVGCPMTLAEIVAFNRRDPERCVPYGQRYLEEALDPRCSMDAPEYLEAKMRIREDFTVPCEALFQAHGLVALITPATSGFAASGLPSVTIPAGKEGGLPVPIVLSGLAYSEAELIAIAATLEHALPGVQ